MDKVYLSLSTRLQKDTGKTEVLLRYRNTRAIGQRALAHLLESEVLRGWRNRHQEQNHHS